MLGFGSSKPSRLRSGTAEHPTAGSLIGHMVTEVISSNRRWEWVTFELRHNRTLPVVEVLHDVGNQELKIYVGLYPFPNDFRSVFVNWGVELPADWRVHKFSKTNWFSSGFLVMATAVTDFERVIDFADRTTAAIAGPGVAYELEGYYQ